MNKKLLLLGGGGHCKSILDSLLVTEAYAQIGIIGNKDDTGKSILGIPVIGCDDNLPELYHRGYTHGFVALGSSGNPAERIRLYTSLERLGFEIPNIIDPTAVISKHATLTRGIFIGKNTVINAGAFVGKGAIINTSSVIEHECHIGEFSHIAPGAVLCGEVRIGLHTHVGANSVVKQQVKIGANTIIGMGSVVLKDISENSLAFGNPCKEVKL